LFRCTPYCKPQRNVICQSSITRKASAFLDILMKISPGRPSSYIAEVMYPFARPRRTCALIDALPRQRLALLRVKPFTLHRSNTAAAASACFSFLLFPAA